MPARPCIVVRVLRSEWFGPLAGHRIRKFIMRSTYLSSRIVHFSVALVALAAFGSAQAAGADGISVRDEGAEGLVLSNLDSLPEPAVAKAPVPVARGAVARPMAESTVRRMEAFAPMVRAAAQAHGLPEALLHAVIEVESGFNAAAVSPKGALGLMQLMPDTARDLRVRDARDPASNIDGGARYLKDLLGRFGNDLSLALAAYNAGPGAVQRSGGIPRNAETQNYVPRVMARYRSLQGSSAE
jgi:soluble lytic murein transglycosylase-like protein